MVSIDASSGPDLLSANGVVSAATLNAHFEATLWAGFYDAISVYHPRFRGYTLGPEELAQTIARWQDAVGGMTVGGALGGMCGVATSSSTENPAMLPGAHTHGAVRREHLAV